MKDKIAKIPLWIAVTMLFGLYGAALSWNYTKDQRQDEALAKKVDKQELSPVLERIDQRIYDLWKRERCNK